MGYCNTGGDLSCKHYSICQVNGTCVYPTYKWLSSSFITQSEKNMLNNELMISYDFPHKFSYYVLLYKASRDGFTAKAFHQLCNGKENTVTIIQTDSNYVFGGYTSQKWRHISGKWGDYARIPDNQAFIFSLRRNGTSSYYKLKIKPRKTAIYSYESYGPVFGESNHSDIFIKDNSNINYSHSYLNNYYLTQNETNDETFLAGAENWLTTEIEVYQLLRHEGQIAFRHEVVAD